MVLPPNTHTQFVVVHVRAVCFVYPFFIYIPFDVVVVVVFWLVTRDVLYILHIFFFPIHTRMKKPITKTHDGGEVVKSQMLSKHNDAN